MKKRYLYFISLTLFVLAAGFVVVRFKSSERIKATRFYPLLERKGIALQLEEWKQVQKKFDELMKIAGTNPDDIKSRLELVSLYIREARATGNYMYYDMAAMKYVNEVLQKEPENFEALTFKSLLYLSQHHFADGLAIAEKAKQINPYNAFVYGILADGNVETGNYKAAIDNADKMVSIRPDMRSYSRISYLREIHGDYPGAIEAMKMAVESGPPGDESTEWTRVQLGHLYENTGDLQSAEMNYVISLRYRPGYAYALAGLARIAAASKDYLKAIRYCLQADSSVTDYSFKDQLAELYSLTGQNDKANTINQWLITAMTNDAESGKNDDNIGHYADRELAYVYLKTKNYDKALEHAIAEYNRRPENIDVNETMAWVYYNEQKYDKALSFLDVAMKTKSNNPVLLAHAGLIYARVGDKTKAKTFLESAAHSNASIPEYLKTDVIAALRQL
jgi:tetratricopeptide (TPR) repeat protein